MTELLITPNFDKKTAKFKGTVAAGESVSVKIANAVDVDTENLRLRVMDFNGRTLAMFKRGFTVIDEVEVDWYDDGEYLTCTLDLNTVEMQSAVCGMCERELLVVLDDPESGILYFKGECEFQGWPKRKGGDIPYELGEYPDIVENLKSRVNEAEESIASHVDEADGIVAQANDVKNAAVKAEEVARQAAVYADTAKEEAARQAQSAAKSADDLQVAVEEAESHKNVAQEAQSAAESAKNEAVAAKNAAEEARDEAGEIAKSTATELVESVKTIAVDAQHKANTLMGGDNNKSARSIAAEEVAKLVDGAPEALDTLQEIADWIAKDETGTQALLAQINGLTDLVSKKADTTAVANSLDGKVDKVPGKGLSTKDYTTAEKDKLAGIEAGAQKNPDLTPYAKKTELVTKRDKADNVAVVDSFSEWESSNPDYILKYGGGSSWYPVLLSFPEAPAGQSKDIGVDSIEVVWEPGEYGVSGDTGPALVFKRNVATKSGEPYVTPTGVKALVPKTELHALVPETSEGKVTLKPVDGKANYVDGKVEAQSKITGRSFSTTYEPCYSYYHASYNEETGEDIYDEFSVIFTCKINDENSVLDRFYQHPKFSDYVVCEIVTSEDIPAEVTGSNTNLFEGVEIPKGMRFIFRFDRNDIGMDGDCTDLSSCSFSVSSCMLETEDVIADVPNTLQIDGREYGLDYYDYPELSFTHQIVRRDITAAVVLPASTDSAKARKFTLAVETDVDAEKTVEWQGGEVIEAVPGASNLVPGLNVWDVAEVAPGKFRVERASRPAQSAPLTLTAPNGRVAELTVGDDLVLEVKEV